MTRDHSAVQTRGIGDGERLVAKVGSTRSDQVGERYGAGCASNGEVAAVADSAGRSNRTATQQGQSRTTTDGRGTGVGVIATEGQCLRAVFEERGGGVVLGVARAADHAADRNIFFRPDEEDIAAMMI